MSQRTVLRVLPLAGVLVALLALYLPTLQTIPNGSDQYFMIDVGETQVVLNVWGTLHATGYPLYTLLGGALVALFKLFGATPAAAPALVSLLWGMSALALVYALALNVGGKVIPAAAATFLFGLTRTVWVHHAIAEIYTFGLLLLLLLLLIALWQPPIRGRLYWLALIGGLAVAHHRGLAMAAPALLVAVWPDLVRPALQIPRKVVLCLLLCLVGFLPYLYLPLRAQAGAGWVYGEPGTWAGFWDQFWGREASRFIGPPQTFDALHGNFDIINGVLAQEFSFAPLVVVGIIGLLAALFQARTRRPALVMLLSGAAAYLFHVALYSDVLSALILPVTLSLAFGLMWFLDLVIGGIWDDIVGRGHSMATRFRAGRAFVLVLPIIALLPFGLIEQNRQFIGALTANPTGLETIRLAEDVLPGSTLMLAWGPRHFAAGFARDVWGQLQDIRLVDHKADFPALAALGPLVTPEYTFYNQPVAWWQERFGRPVYLRAIAPRLIQIDTTPERAEVDQLDRVAEAVSCSADQLLLAVTWAAPETPAQDLSVFVHLLDADGNLIAQADQSAPVYGWRPLTSWMPGEAIRDLYPLPRDPAAATIRYGLYRQLADGQFENVIEHTLPVECETS